MNGALGVSAVRVPPARFYRHNLRNVGFLRGSVPLCHSLTNRTSENRILRKRDNNRSGIDPLKFGALNYLIV